MSVLASTLLAILAIEASGQPAAGAPAAAPDSGWFDHLRAARAAFARNDLAIARPELERVDAMVGGHAGAMYAIAGIAARQGDRRAALRWLAEYAATGLSRRASRDTSFTSLVADPEFLAIAARLDSNAVPIAHSVVATGFTDAAMLAEDIAWDPIHRRFLISSIHRRKIVAVDSAGRTSDLVAAKEADLWGFYALAVDTVRGRLWATVAAGPMCEGWTPTDSGRTALVGFDLASGKRLARIELQRDGHRHVLGDIAVGWDGTVYLTESLGGGVYRLAPWATRLETLAPSGTFGSPQMPVVTRDGRRLLIADYTRGIAALDLGTRAITWLAKPRTFASGGIDGLCRDGHALIAIQNGTSPRRVLRLTLDEAETRIITWQVLEQASEWLGEPNHGVIVGKALYFIGNSGWERVNEREELETPAAARPPVILGLELPRQ
jgi:sugar lactone lactonase YvrE